MPGGGVLTIELSATTRAAPHTCTLRVTDDGAGMSAEVRERACEPFFSTKHRATNSGLGLSICYGIVKSLGGTLALASEPGRGTTVAITLPCADVAPVGERVVEVLRPRRVDGTALLIEDDAAVRQALVRMVSALGCEVIAVESGERAVELLAGDRAVDFVLSDLIMPGLQGPALVDALRALRPQLPIVFLSGYTDATAGAMGLRARGIEVLQKPPDGQQLIAGIERARNPGAFTEGKTGAADADGGATVRG
jgi:CheY-like chemotaxis protein